MKKVIVIVAAVLCLAACVSEDTKSSQKEQQNEGIDTMQVVCQNIENKTPQEGHLYDEAKHFDMLFKIFRLNGGSYNPYSLFNQFAAAYCKHCAVTVGGEYWTSAELCHEWLESYLGKEKCQKLNIDSDDLMSYLNGCPEKVHKGIVPDVAKTKRLLKKYCIEVYLPKHTVEQCYRDGGFDTYALDYTFDGQGAVDWTERHWNEYVDIRFVKSEYDTKQSTDSTDVFKMTFQYHFAPSKKYGSKPHDDIEFIVDLTEERNGEFYYGIPEITHYLNQQ